MKKVILFMLVCFTLCSCDNRKQHKVENCGVYYEEVKMHGGHEYYLYYKHPYGIHPFDTEHKIDCKKCLDLFD